MIATLVTLLLITTGASAAALLQWYLLDIQVDALQDELTQADAWLRHERDARKAAERELAENRTMITAVFNLTSDKVRAALEHAAPVAAPAARRRPATKKTTTTAGGAR